MENNERQERFLELYEQSRESLVRFARSLSSTNDDAKDLVQETTLAAYERFDSVKHPVAFKSFLFTIACRIHKRQTWRKRLFVRFQTADKNEIDDLVAPNSNSDALYDIQALHKALRSLPKNQSQAVVLHEISGLTMEEIAVIQDVSVSGVKSRVQRGRKELSRILNGKGSGRPEYQREPSLATSRVYAYSGAESYTENRAYLLEVLNDK